MDELTTLMTNFRAERVKEDPEARATIWAAVEAHLEPAAAAAPVSPAAPRRRLLFRRRRLFAFAGATALAALAAGVLVLSSGPTAQPAAAELLHRTATIAAATEGPADVPGPGQFLYKKFKRVELEGWIPVDEAGADSPLAIGGAPYTGPNADKAFSALMPTTQEWWTAADGAGRTREVAGTPRFLTTEERSRWEATGSRLPPPFDPEYQRKFPLAYEGALELREGVVDTEHQKMKGFRFPDTSSLPTEPEALRLAVESNQISLTGFNLMYPSAEQLDTQQTTAELINILVEGNPMRPQLRAALFNALAELPGIEVDTDATDFLGRQGYAIRSIDPKTGGGEEFIFDPNTSDVLAQRSFLGDPRKQDPPWRGLPSGLTIRETDYLETGVVDSTRETAAEAEAEGPVATTDPSYRK